MTFGFSSIFDFWNDFNTPGDHTMSWGPTVEDATAGDYEKPASLPEKRRFFSFDPALRIEAAAIEAWGFTQCLSDTVVGADSAYQVLRRYYFQLRKSLHPSTRDRVFTKDEAGFILNLLGVEEPARAKRQSSGQRNVQLATTMAAGGGYRHQYIQSLVKQCAVKHLCRGTGD
jgi:hypothetical protein